MRSVSATLFTRRFAAFQHEVHREPVQVTSHSRVVGYFVAPEEYAEYKALREKARKNLVVRQLPDETVNALEEARMDSRHAHLNALMQD
jgi:hypothetical protein